MCELAENRTDQMGSSLCHRSLNSRCLPANLSTTLSNSSCKVSPMSQTTSNLTALLPDT